MTATWHTPQTWNTNDLVTATNLNEQLRDNMEWLKAKTSTNRYVDESSDYTTTSTSFVNVDGTNLSLSLTTVGGDVLIGFASAVNYSASGGLIYFDVEIDGTRFGLNDGIVLINSPTANGTMNASFVVLKTGLSAASHTFKLQWKVNSGTAKIFAGAATSAADLHPQFWVREV